jgi:hypothetical protein|tara:strand:+ start:16153 stop:16425 length:273 start_codon:yes stop_codon:yes gene_type:complete
MAKIIDKTWSIKHEGKLNPNNIIFTNNKYLKLVSKLKEVDDSLGADYEPEYVSDCCTHSAFGNSFIEEELTGICGKCFDGANFSDLNEEL